jgi:uncharacterized membrane protein YeaQ/YmgE (transglycosylase-associated protein family)
MGIIATIILGLVIGFIAKLIWTGAEPGGFIGTLAVGLIGAFIGKFIASALNWSTFNHFFELKTWIVSIAGAIILLLVYDLFVGGSSRRSRRHGLV